MLVGVVVLYHPNTQKVIQNINSYMDQLDKLIIVDNSENIQHGVVEFYESNPSVIYQSFGENKGIAFALNKGIAFAKECKASWLLTMDQDSWFAQKEFARYVHIVQNISSRYSDGVLFSPRHKVPYLTKKDGISKVDKVMTSGNLIKMEMIDEIGYFDEKLFIDSVDHEFCYRINRKGYGVYRVNEIELVHHLGNLVTKDLFGTKLYITNHNFIRWYYITRNLLYVEKLYAVNQRAFYQFSKQHLFWSCLKITLYEKEKLLKLKSILLGLIDFKRGKFGKKEFNQK